MSSLRLILGDQLSHGLASLRNVDKENDILLMCEVCNEATYVKHHKKKIAFLFSAMRHFAEELKHRGYNLLYTKLDSPENSGSLRGEVSRAVNAHKPEQIIITFPGEFRVYQDMLGWEKEFGLPVEIRQDDRFLCSLAQFQEWAEGRKNLRMEFFYREMRRKYDVLMDDDKPAGGQWNYDSQNRKSLKEQINIPAAYSGQIDKITQTCIELVAERFFDHFGDLEPFYFAVTREQALDCLHKFIDERLLNFGDYQDAMVQGEPWMYHSHISFYLNCGLLGPLECCRHAEEAYRSGEAPINAVEGFIRQILGWREYVRGIYWLKMPSYAEDNYLQARRRLPAFFWDANTKMNCMRQCITETKVNAYAHHIQRLMVLGNFCLLTGIDPKFVNEWYLIVYADAYEWVELPNVSGMVLYADGGLLASKPYVAGGAYINRMSDYCKACSYSVSKKNGPEACPFNYLYWNFLIGHEENLSGNPRMGHSYRTLSKMNSEKQEAIRNDAARFLNRMGNGEV
ncbi:MAG: cryptochrome/photolyase family protein [Arenicellales bacterium]